MTITTIGLDLAKSVFQAHGIDESGATVLVKKLHRKQMLPFFSKLSPCLIGVEPGGLALFISQSGETADTLAALRHAKAADQIIAVVVNVPTSSMAREADLLLPTHAGPEIGVASTKAFTCQLAVLAALAASLARAKGLLTPVEEAEIVWHLSEAPAAMNEALGHDGEIEAMALSMAE